MGFIKKLREKQGTHGFGFTELLKQFIATPVAEQAEAGVVYEESAYIKRLEKGFGPTTTRKSKKKLYNSEEKVEVKTNSKAQKLQDKNKQDYERE